MTTRVRCLVKPLHPSICLIPSVSLCPVSFVHLTVAKRTESVIALSEALMIMSCDADEVVSCVSLVLVLLGCCCCRAAGKNRPRDTHLIQHLIITDACVKDSMISIFTNIKKVIDCELKVHVLYVIII